MHVALQGSQVVKLRDQNCLKGGGYVHVRLTQRGRQHACKFVLSHTETLPRRTKRFNIDESIPAEVQQRI